MNSFRLAFAFLVCAAASALAQNATLTADTNTLSPSGGTVSLTATVSYEGEPGAVGWSIVLPADWSLVGVSGPEVPAVSPDAGATGTLEFAYTALPPQQATFVVTVRYPANAPTTAAVPTVLVRANGKLATLSPKPVQLNGTIDRAPSARER
jgi:hypothetical protein